MATKTTKKAVTTKAAPVKKAKIAKSHAAPCRVMNCCVGFYGCYVKGITRYIKPFFALFLRLWMARIFLYSGLAKISGWNTTLELFENEYKVPDISPIFTAYSSAGFEIICAVFLAIGFMSRLAVLPLMAISLAIYSSGTSIEHMCWATMLATIFCYGPGCISIDAIIKCKYCKDEMV
jgi:putative oxidoreductase